MRNLNKRRLASSLVLSSWVWVAGYACSDDDGERQAPTGADAGYQDAAASDAGDTRPSHSEAGPSTTDTDEASSNGSDDTTTATDDSTSDTAGSSVETDAGTGTDAGSACELSLIESATLMEADGFLGTFDVSVTLSQSGDGAAVVWTAVGGSFEDPEEADTQFYCSLSGELTLTVTADDGDCTDAAHVTVDCAQVSCADTELEPGLPCDNPLPIVHHFAPTIPDAFTARELPSEPDGTRDVPTELQATDVRSIPVSLDVDGQTVDGELQATPEVPDDVLSYLLATIQVLPFDNQLHKDFLAEMTVGNPVLRAGVPEIQLPGLYDENQNHLIYLLPDGFAWVRPWVIRWRTDLDQGMPDSSTGDVGVVTQALTGEWSTVRGLLECDAPDARPQPLKFVEVTVAGQTTHTDALGQFEVSGTFTDVDQADVRYTGTVVTPLSDGEVSGALTVMNDFHNPRSEAFDVPEGTTTDGVLDVGTLTSSSLDCELYDIGSQVLDEYQALVGAAPPAGGLRIKRWEGVDVGTPYAFYDYVVIAKGFRDFARTRASRVDTMFHELGHTVRHVADGDNGHWNWDNFRWVYARAHSGTEIFNEQYAFNEGFGQYWECTRVGATSCPVILPGTPNVSFLDWNELRIGERLLAMSMQPGFSPAAMVAILTENPGVIHTFREFETLYCADAGDNDFCADGEPTREKSACPPGFVDDGLTCRQDNILAKDSYVRSGGWLPIGCDTDEEQDGLLCYDDCPAGYNGVGPLCWENCPSGYHDDGAFCRRDAWIFGSDNSACPWYDVCGLTFAGGCSVCPAGFNNDGCFCRRDAHIFAKRTVGRGVGNVMTACDTGLVYDAGLCFEPCDAGYTGVSFVCWGQCPSDYDDHGATCYRPPNVLTKH